MQLRRCAPILILFLCSLLASCGKSSASDAPKEGRAGLVKEVEGIVNATRAGQVTRTLSKGDTIYVDDSLESGDGASAVILFAHNNATWQLSAGYTGAVVDSLPWRTKRHETSALVRTEQTQTAAAGRNSEREAAESIETMQPSAVMREEEEDEFAGESNPIEEAPSAVATVKPALGNAVRHPRPASKTTPSPGTGKASKGFTESAGLLGGVPAGKAKAKGRVGAAKKHDHDRGEKNVAPVAAARADEASDDDTKAESPSNPAARIAKAETSSGAEVSRRRFLALVKSVGTVCRPTKISDGKITIVLVVTNSKLKKLEVKGPAHLGKYSKCVKSKLRRQSHKGSFSVRTSITISAN